MSIHFIRSLKHWSSHGGASKCVRIINVQPDRNYHIENSRVLQKSNGHQAVMRYSNVRHSSTGPPILPHPFGELQWHSHTNKFLKAIEGFAESDVVLAATEKAIQFHNYTGLPWWSVIVLSTLAVRTFITFPFAVHQQYVSGKYEQVITEVDTVVDKEITQKVNKLAEKNAWNQKQLTAEYLRQKQERKVELIRKYNCHPLKLSIMVLIQAPIWMGISCVIRNLTYMRPVKDATAEAVHTELQQESFLWMSDLTVPDMYIPILFTLGNMTTVGTNVIARKGKKTPIEKLIVVIHSTFCIALCTFAYDIPLSIILYWTTSAWYSAIQNIVFMSPKIRSRLNLPLGQNLRPNPIRKFFGKFKGLYKFFRY